MPTRPPGALQRPKKMAFRGVPEPEIPERVRLNVLELASAFVAEPMLPADRADFTVPDDYSINRPPR